MLHKLFSGLYSFSDLTGLAGLFPAMARNDQGDDKMDSPCVAMESAVVTQKKIRPPPGLSKIPSCYHSEQEVHPTRLEKRNRVLDAIRATTTYQIYKKYQAGVSSSDSDVQDDQTPLTVTPDRHELPSTPRVTIKSKRAWETACQEWRSCMRDIMELELKSKECAPMNSLRTWEPALFLYVGGFRSTLPPTAANLINEGNASEVFVFFSSLTGLASSLMMFACETQCKVAKCKAAMNN